MTINKDHFNKIDFIPKLLTILATIFLCTVFVFSLFSYQSFTALLKANANRYQSYLLTEQLRHSSDQLTLMARAYAVTQDKKYLSFFNKIIAIREGESPRPLNYERVYWDFLMPKNGSAPFKFSQQKSLNQLMLESGIQKNELDQLESAKTESDRLTQLESQAFELTMNFTESDKQAAINILYSEDYFQTKIKIMAYINEFYQLQEARTSQNIHQLNHQLNLKVGIAITGFIGLLICILLIFYFRMRFNKSLLNLLSHEVDKQTVLLNQKNEQLEQNIEQIKQAQSQLIESEKMASLGNLVAGVAHEVNTPLGTSVALASHLEHEVLELRKGVEAGTLKRSQLENFLSAAIENCQLLLSNNERAANLISSFKKIAVDQSSEALSEFTVDAYLTDTIRSLNHKFKNTPVTIDTRVLGQTPVITSYPGVFSQVISNLLLNSLIHGFDNGKLTGQIEIVIEQTQQYLTVNYRDNGKGMNHEQQKRIFDPFYTTKRGQGGSGLGMSIVYNLITHKMQGEISCESKFNQGTSFTIKLPLLIENKNS
ncbi:sensor histidine kinase [Parashewanella hymeniacidonis]|uniref:sensor histidine kinase n=1 Tax=Parashewanella hymeniacidonis TaxID=2807618 RepID=UPI00196038DA|nr:HAMP domain-containing sensor histidine kinase [Parashewanella hymeniacidonis]